MPVSLNYRVVYLTPGGVTKRARVADTKLGCVALMEEIKEEDGTVQEVQECIPWGCVAPRRLLRNWTPDEKGELNFG